MPYPNTQKNVLYIRFKVSCFIMCPEVTTWQCAQLVVPASGFKADSLSFWVVENSWLGFKIQNYYGLFPVCFKATQDELLRFR